MGRQGTDWDAEGLLDDLSGEPREARRRLLERTLEQGATLDDLRRAAAEGRLAALPAELTLGGPPRFSAREAARQAGLELDFLLELRRATGVAASDPDAPLLSAADLEASSLTSEVMRAGVSAEQVSATAPVLAQALRQIAEQLTDVIVALAYVPDLPEDELAERLAREVARYLPFISRVVENGLRLQFREAVREAAIAAAERSAGGLPDSRVVAVAFVDLVGFTRLGEELPAAELERIARRLSEMAAEATEPPVRLVKSLGDAVMLVSPEPEALLAGVLEIVDLADAGPPDFPRARAGIALGSAVTGGGDWYGRPVNLASRLTTIARPGSVLVTDTLREAVDRGFRFSEAGVRRLHGMPEPVAVFRARRDGEPA